MDTVILSRSRTRMYTAFVTADGRGILNIAVSDGGGQRCVSIPLDTDEQAVMARDDQSSLDLADALARSGGRLADALPTPPLGTAELGLRRAA